MPICARELRGSSSTRTAYFCAPNTCTCATPLTIEMRCAIVVSAYSSSVDSGSVFEVSARIQTGWSAGLTFCTTAAPASRRQLARRLRDHRLHVLRGGVDVAARGRTAA
jgi:hypothetical protein